MTIVEQCAILQFLVNVFNSVVRFFFTLISHTVLSWFSHPLENVLFQEEDLVRAEMNKLVNVLTWSNLLPVSLFFSEMIVFYGCPSFQKQLEDVLEKSKKLRKHWKTALETFDVSLLFTFLSLFPLLCRSFLPTRRSVRISTRLSCGR